MIRREVSAKLTVILFSLLGILCGVVRLRAQESPKPIGIFEQHQDIGNVLHAGSVDYDAAKHMYTIAGSGENMWFTSDAFQFLWKRVSGNFRLTADIRFLGSGGDPHRKAVLMIRQNLDADSTYADVAFHGVGLTSLQSRAERSATTHEVQAAISGPKRLGIEKRGQDVLMYLSADGGDVEFSGASIKLAIGAPFYVGLGVCAHNKDAVEKAAFSNVEFAELPEAAGPPVLYSTVETVAVGSTDRRVEYVRPGRIAGPVWTADGIVFDSGGHYERIPVEGGKPQPVRRPDIRADAAQHDIRSDEWSNSGTYSSPDSKNVAFLSYGKDASPIIDKDVMLRLLSVADDKVTVLAKFVGGLGSLGAPWSPDGRRLVFVSYHYLAK